MGDINWGLLTTPDFAGNALASYTAGQKLGDQIAVRNALADYSPDDPASLAKAQASLARRGLVKEANALSEMALSATKRRLLNSGEAMLSGRASTPAAPLTPSSADGGGSATTGLQGQPDGLRQLELLRDNLLALPEEQRADAISRAKINGQPLPAEVLKRVDLSDDGLSGLDTVFSKLRSSPSAGQPVAAAPGFSEPYAPARTRGPAAAPSAPALTTGGSGFDLRRDGRALGLMALGGADVGPIVDIAKATQPKPTNVNGFMVDENDPATVGRYLPKLPDGSTPLYDGQGRVVAARTLDGVIQTTQEIAAAQARGKAEGELPYAGPTARATAAGKAEGESGYDLIEVPDGNGGTEMMPKAEYLRMRRGFASGGGGVAAPAGGALGGAVGAGGPRMGRKLSPGDLAWQTKDAETGAALVNGATQDREDAIASHQTAMQAMKFAQKLDPNAFTGAKAQTARFLSALGVKNATAFANDSDAYQRATETELRTLAATFKGQQSDRELAVIQRMRPGLTTPRDSALLYFATVAANAERKQSYADFRADYDGPKSGQAVEKAWRQSAAGQQSIFQSPAFQNLSFNGQPLVTFSKRADRNGSYYGRVNVGGGEPFYFKVQQ